MLKRAIAVSLCGLVATTVAIGADRTAWVDTWACAPDSAGALLKAQTVRQIVRTSVAGTQVRIRLSNLFGSGPLTVGNVHLASHATGADIVPGTDHALRFEGKSGVTIPKGQSVWSDPVAMNVGALQELAVSIYVPPGSVDGPSTIHNAGLATAFVNESGDATSTVHFPADETSGNRFLITDIAVSGPVARQTVVAFGDSITDGVGSTPGANQRWPDYLAARLQVDKSLATIGVANSGIGGNRILQDNFGPSALARFDRDALDKPGVHWVVLLEGINDIGGSGYAIAAKDKVSAQQIIDGMKTLIARAHTKGVKIYGATLTPFGGAGWPYHSVVGEQEREAVNTWIRTSGAFDGVVDFEAAVRDPAHPERMLAAYDSGDHLHPNSAGYQAMANAIDLKLFHP
ncbi:SGNH/GDSL hydrolase family protein [Dyella mobilis]|uniref:SGNH/GDSL hydrolase family protein n=1 Tax=Dyella mobilis TaxID=1849582 RepID=A0ABS2K9W1_9GAMM|nr:SGNH/GDSL hydrolase family protein [Dyella mobilis]